MSGNPPKITVCSDIGDISTRAAGAFIDIANRAIVDSGIFTVALSGGSTPEALYRLLATDEYRSRIDWSKAHPFWGDERRVPSDHPDSNYRMAYETLISKVDIPANNIHRIRGELGEDAACEYEREIKEVFQLKGNELPNFDLILLGMGDDGHTASIFPGTPAVHEDGGIVTAVYVEKLKSTRITLTPPVINNSSNIIFLVSGENKAAALKQVLEGDYMPEKYPAQFIRNAKGRVTWFVDRGAASGLTT